MSVCPFVNPSDPHGDRDSPGQPAGTCHERSRDVSGTSVPALANTVSVLKCAQRGHTPLELTASNVATSGFLFQAADGAACFTPLLVWTKMA